MQYESEHIEYKSQMVDDIYKEGHRLCQYGRRRDLASALNDQAM